MPWLLRNQTNLNPLLRKSSLSIAALTIVSAAFGQAKLEGIEARRVATGLNIAIKGADLPQPKIVRAWQNKSYILEFDGNLIGKSRRVKVGVAGVESVEYGWFSAKPPKVRVHLRLDPNSEPTVQKINDEWVIVVSGDSGVPFAAPSVTPKVNAADPTVSGNSSPIERPIRDTSLISNLGGGASAERPPAKPVEPGSSAKVNSSSTLPKTTVKTNNVVALKTPNVVPTAEKLINLEFTGASIPVVLRAIALQAGVDIVAAPDVKGEITVSLTKKRVDEALDFVTAISGLRYGKVGRTYIVAPRDKFSEILRNFNKSADDVSEPRIVPVYSGEVEQIKAVVTKAFPADTVRGSFDILLPSEMAGKEEDSGTKPPAGGAPPAGNEGPKGGNESSRPNRQNLYVMLVGSREVLDDVERLVKSVDESLCAANGISVPTSSQMVQDTYVLKSDSVTAKNLIDTVSSLEGVAFRGVEMYPTPQSSGRQAIILLGRDTEISRVKNLLLEFDGSGDTLVIYDVKYADPRALRDDVINFVPGLRANIPPASAGAPRLYQAKGAAGANQSQGAENGAGAGNAADTAAKGEDGRIEGLSAPFQDYEKVAYPMTLVLRGTPAQVSKAMAYLDKIDLAPKQIAVDLRVVELSKEEALKIGLRWDLATGGFLKTFEVNNSQGATISQDGTIKGTFSNGNVSGNLVDSVLDQVDSSRKLLSRPNLFVQDGRETELFIGDTYRYIESIQSSQNGITVTTGEVKVGVRMAVMARVGAEGKITMDLRPLVSYLRGFTPVPGGGQLPQTSERMAQFTVTLNSGDTIALGGLIRDEDRKTVGGIPILRDLPIVGQLFKRTDTSKVRSEVVFFITTRQVNDEDRGRAAAPRDAFKNNPKVEEQLSAKELKDLQKKKSGDK